MWTHIWALFTQNLSKTKVKLQWNTLYLKLPSFLISRPPPPPTDLTLVWDWNCYIDTTVFHFLTGWLNSVKRGSVGNTWLWYLGSKCCLFQWLFFSGGLRSGGLSFNWANVIFAAYFIMSGRDMHTDFLRLLLVGMICPPMPEHVLWPLMKHKALHCG